MITHENNHLLANRILPLIDLTSLNLDDTETVIKTLCLQAKTPVGNTAAVCVYPQFLPLIKKYLKNSSIKIAAVANFPEGTSALEDVVHDIKKSIAMGANEIDVVMPYKKYLSGNNSEVKNFIRVCKNTCDDALLKVILETGALLKPEMIADASRDVILSGADFIKTSTGKISIGATLEAAKIMLEVIRDLKLNRTVGFKTSGGIRTLPQAASYLQLADEIMGSDWVTPQTFRIGASSLMHEVQKYLK